MRVTLILVTLVAAGCFEPRYEEGGFSCGPARLCPSGFLCRSDGRCATSGDSPDLGGATGDGAMVSLDDGGGGATDLGPSGPFVGSGMLGDLDLTGVSGVVRCNTETGEMTLDGTGVPIIDTGRMGFTRVTQADGPPAAVWSFRDLVIPSTVTLKPSSSSVSVLVLAATGRMSIDGTIAWAGYGGFGGLAGTAGQSRGASVAGGGGAYGTDGSGGGGGGHVVVGVKGGGVAPGASGAAYGTNDLRIVHFGAGGGGGGNANGGLGGNGGGAVALFASELVVRGRIDVSGLTADPGGSGVAGGGGGGSGGSLLLGGGTITLDATGLGGAAQLVATGGRGGSAGAGGGFAGGDGAAGRIYLATPTLSVAGGTISAMPAPLVSPNAITTFPR